jgi:hypothetical protein
MLGVAFESYIIFTIQTSSILAQPDLFSSSPNSATIQYSYQHIAEENAHTTDVIGERIHHCLLHHAGSSAKGGCPLGS